MIVSMSDAITLSKAERMELTQRATSQAGRADDARRARLILKLEAGETWAEIRDKLACNDDFIDRWSKRFGAERLAGLFSRHAGQAASTLPLYRHPPQHAAVFCVDEKTAIQALDRLNPVLPLSPGRAERHAFEYYRHGTLSLYAALDVKTGQVHGMTAGRHTSQQFIAFLGGLLARTKSAREIHVVLDNLSAHKTNQVDEFLERHRNVR